MIQPDALLQLFRYNHQLVTQQMAEITHAESLMQPPFEANCLNWLLGHIISSRSSVLRMVGQPSVWTEEQRSRYRYGSEPITQADNGVLRLETLLSDFNVSQERLTMGLAGMSYDDLCQPSGFNNNTLGESLLYFQYHEVYHIGQMTYLSQMLGKKGVWLS